jgi:hypothetical protein
MSGGSMNHIYSRLEAEAVFDADTPERRAFAKHLVKVVRALKAIEFVDSGDCSAGDEECAIRDCLGKGDILRSAVEMAEGTMAQLQAEIRRAKS